MTKNHDHSADRKAPKPRGEKVLREIPVEPIHYPADHPHTPEHLDPNEPAPETPNRVDGIFPVMDGAKDPDSGEGAGAWRHKK
ncbi:hypothetical protein [Lysinibacter sp. HNR]|uniref:hypothetical protein n=1 Tax=Lysinibacter sp. HNR TaxID=3031408 RepID=UPI00243613CB|nr:hypothetical protein [Lysinibacter sp. HNR]WGD36584.1 hypothetical protein FrondiHNR_08910 [Lysinibacter sp. HNR]